MSIVYLDGEYLPEHEAKLPVMNRGFLFGDGVYATIQVNDGKPLFLDIHLERLKNQSRNFHLQPPEIDVRAITTLIEKNQATQGIWKLKVIVMGDETPEMRLPNRKATHLLMFIHPFQPAPYQPLKLSLYPLPVMTAHATFKSLAHLSRYFVMEHGLSTGGDDAVTTTESGILLEASFGNLFWIEGKNFYTPDPALPLHFGVTIAQLTELVQKLGYAVKFVKIAPQDIPEGAFLFRCNTMSGIRPVGTLEKKEFFRDLSLEELLLSGFAARAGIKSLGSQRL